MFGPRRVLQSQLRLLAPQYLALSRFQASRNVSSVAPNPTTEPSKWPRRLVYAAIFGSLGTFAGKWMDEKVSAPPRPGSDEDRRRLEGIQHVYEHQLPIVKKLRNNPDYIEDNVYVNYSDDDKMNRFTSGLLRGSRGVAFQVCSTLFQVEERLAPLAHCQNCRTDDCPNTGKWRCMSLGTFYSRN